MGVDGFDALECPPTGDVDLAEVKWKFGGKISLRGNVNLIHVMLNGKPKDVEEDIIRCMKSAKAGGGGAGIYAASIASCVISKSLG